MTKPKYKVGDRIGGCSFLVRGIGTKSTGEHLYFLQVDDNFMVVGQDDLIHISNMQATAMSDSCYTPPCPVCGCEFCKCG